MLPSNSNVHSIHQYSKRRHALWGCKAIELGVTHNWFLVLAALEKELFCCPLPQYFQPELEWGPIGEYTFIFHPLNACGETETNQPRQSKCITISSFHFVLSQHQHLKSLEFNLQHHSSNFETKYTNHHLLSDRFQGLLGIYICIHTYNVPVQRINYSKWKRKKYNGCMILSQS